MLLQSIRVGSIVGSCDKKWTQMGAFVWTSYCINYSSEIYTVIPVSNELIESMNYLAGHFPSSVLYQFVMGLFFFSFKLKRRNS